MKMKKGYDFFLIILGVILCFNLFTIGNSDLPAGFVLDTKEKSVKVVDLSTGEIQKSITLSGEPVAMRQTPDGSKLIVLNRIMGKVKTAILKGPRFIPYRATKISIIDIASRSVTTTLTLGWGLQDTYFERGSFNFKAKFGMDNFHFSEDGKFLSVLCTGFQAKPPRISRPCELVTVDLEKGEIAGRVNMERKAYNVIYTPGSRTAVAFLPGILSKKKQSFPAEFKFIDLDHFKVSGKITPQPSLTHFLFSPESKYLYLLNVGELENNIPSTLQAVSLATFKVEKTLELGFKLMNFSIDKPACQILVVSSGKKNGEDVPGETMLHIIRGSEIMKNIPVAAGHRLLRITPNRKHLFAIGEKEMTVVDYVSLEIAKVIPYESPAKLSVKEFAITPDEKRGLILYSDSSKLSILNLDTGKSIALVTTGRKNLKKLTKFLGVVLSGVGSALNQRIGERLNQPNYKSFREDLYLLDSPNTDLMVRGDGKFCYVANNQTSDVTVVDTKDGKVLKKFGAAIASGFKPLPGNVIGMFAGSSLEFLDAAKNEKIGRVGLGIDGYLNQFLTLPDEVHGIALSGRAVYSINIPSAEVVWKNKKFKEPKEIFYEGKKHPTQAEEASVAIDADSTFETLLRALKSPRPDVRERAAAALGNVKNSRSEEILASLINDKNFYVRSKAAEILKNWGWDSKNDVNRVHILIAQRKWKEIAELGQVVIEPMLQVMKSKNLEPRTNASTVLQKIGSPAVDYLLKALSDENSYLRATAAFTFGKIKESRTIEPLITFLKDNHQYVIDNAVLALVEIGKPAVLPLISATKNENDQIRIEAVKILGELKDNRAIEPLIDALNDGNPAVRSCAFVSLHAITKKSFGINHTKWKKWWKKNK